MKVEVFAGKLLSAVRKSGCESRVLENTEAFFDDFLRGAAFEQQSVFAVGDVVTDVGARDDCGAAAGEKLRDF